MPPCPASLGLLPAHRLCLHFPTAGLLPGAVCSILAELTLWHSSSSVLSCPVHCRSLPWLLWLVPSSTSTTSCSALSFPASLSHRLHSLLVHLNMTDQTRPISFSTALRGACARFHGSLYCPHFAWLLSSGWTTRIHPEGCRVGIKLPGSTGTIATMAHKNRAFGQLCFLLG